MPFFFDVVDAELIGCGSGCSAYIPDGFLSFFYFFIYFLIFILFFYFLNFLFF